MLRVGVVDVRVASNHGAAAVAAWRAARHRIWLTGYRVTLATDAGETQRAIVARIQGAVRAHRRGGEPAELDIVCHGGGAAYRGPVVPDGSSDATHGFSAVQYVWQIGTSLSQDGVAFWAPLAGVFRRVRVFACGEREATLARLPLAGPVGREALCRRFADVLQAEVVSAPGRSVSAVAPDPDAYTITTGGVRLSLLPSDPSGITVHGWDGSEPLQVFLPGGRMRTLPPSDRLGR